MNAQQIMTADPWRVDERATVAQAYEMLSQSEIRHLPVVRDGEVRGMLSDRDFRDLGLELIQDEASLERAQTQLQQPVSALMHADVITVDREADVQEIVDLMLEERIGALPVIERETGQIAGIVSYIDVLRAAREQLLE